MKSHTEQLIGFWLRTGSYENHFHGDELADLGEELEEIVFEIQEGRLGLRLPALSQPYSPLHLLFIKALNEWVVEINRFKSKYPLHKEEIKQLHSTATTRLQSAQFKRESRESIQKIQDDYKIDVQKLKDELAIDMKKRSVRLMPLTTNLFIALETLFQSKDPNDVKIAVLLKRHTSVQNTRDDTSLAAFLTTSLAIVEINFLIESTGSGNPLALDTLEQLIHSDMIEELENYCEHLQSKNKELFSTDILALTQSLHAFTNQFLQLKTTLTRCKALIDEIKSIIITKNSGQAYDKTELDDLSLAFTTHLSIIISHFRTLKACTDELNVKYVKELEHDQSERENPASLTEKRILETLIRSISAPTNPSSKSSLPKTMAITNINSPFSLFSPSLTASDFKQANTATLLKHLNNFYQSSSSSSSNTTLGEMRKAVFKILSFYKNNNKSTDNIVVKHKLEAISLIERLISFAPNIPSLRSATHMLVDILDNRELMENDKDTRDLQIDLLRACESDKDDSTQSLASIRTSPIIPIYQQLKEFQALRKTFIAELIEKLQKNRAEPNIINQIYEKTLFSIIPKMEMSLHFNEENVPDGISFFYHTRSESYQPKNGITLSFEELPEHFQQYAKEVLRTEKRAEIEKSYYSDIPTILEKLAYQRPDPTLLTFTTGSLPMRMDTIEEIISNMKIDINVLQTTKPKKSLRFITTEERQYDCVRFIADNTKVDFMELEEKYQNNLFIKFHMKNAPTPRKAATIYSNNESTSLTEDQIDALERLLSKNQIPSFSELSQNNAIFEDPSFVAEIIATLKLEPSVKTEVRFFTRDPNEETSKKPQFPAKSSSPRAPSK